MKRLITVLKVTFWGFALVNLFLITILLIDSAIDKTPVPWDYLGFVNLYGMVASVILGYMDRPILEKRLLILITISSAVLLLFSFINDIEALRMHSIYILIGVSAGRNMVLIVDMSLRKNKS